MFRFVVLCAVIVLVEGQSTSVSECILNPAPLPLNVYVEGCEEPPCSFPQLQDAVIHVIFKAPRDLDNLRTLATASVSFGIGSIDIPYDLAENAKTCNFLTNTYCPIVADEVVQYTIKMYIQIFFPAGTAATVEFRIADEAGEGVWCIRVPIRIIPPVRALDGRQRRNATEGIRVTRVN